MSVNDPVGAISQRARDPSSLIHAPAESRSNGEKRALAMTQDLSCGKNPARCTRNKNHPEGQQRSTS